MTVFRTQEKQIKSDYNRVQEEKKQLQDMLSKLKRFINKTFDAKNRISLDVF